MYLHPKSYGNQPIVNKNCQTASLIHQMVLTTHNATGLISPVLTSSRVI